VVRILNMAIMLKKYNIQPLKYTIVNYSTRIFFVLKTNIEIMVIVHGDKLCCV